MTTTEPRTEQHTCHLERQAIGEPALWVSRSECTCGWTGDWMHAGQRAVEQGAEHQQVTITEPAITPCPVEWCDQFGRHLFDDEQPAVIAEAARYGYPLTGLSRACRHEVGSAEVGEVGAEMLTNYVELDADGTVVASEPGSWSWTGTPAAEWSEGQADEMLAGMGWRRTGPWEFQGDIAGLPGSTAPVEHA